jgi:Tol biopolymer transport system component
VRHARWVLAIAIAIVAALMPAAAGATFPGANGKLAFTSGTFAGQTISTVNPDGTDAREIRSTVPGFGPTNMHPSWSNGGGLIAFASAASLFPLPRWDLWTMAPDGTGARQILDHDTAGVVVLDKPAWSPDGKTIAFTGRPSANESSVCKRDWYWDYLDRKGCNLGVYTYDPRFRVLTRIASGFEPAWSPNGERIAFSAFRGDTTEIYTTKPDGSAAVQVTNNAARDEEPSWSPDGTELAFTSDRDGQVTAFAQYGCCVGGPGEIYVMGADGTGVRRLTVNPALDASPAWSPDGTKIAFTSTRRTPNCDPNVLLTFHCQSDVYVMNADGSDQHLVAFFGYDVDWQPLNRPPDCSSVSATPSSLFPPNGKLVSVTLGGGTDPDGDPVSLVITGVTQDEPPGGAPDAVLGPAPNQVSLRAKRDGGGDGRVYRVAFDATDGRGGECTGTAVVGVPHDQGSVARDSAPPSFDSLRP